MKQTFLAFVLFAFGTTSMFADTITAAGAAFANLNGQNFLISGIGQPATPLFVNRSTDAGFNQGTGRNFTGLTSGPGTQNQANLNLGNFLVGNGDWAASGYGALPGLSASNLNVLTTGGTTGGAAPSNFFFNNAGGTYQATLLLSLTGNNLEFGWYDASNGNRTSLFTNTGCNPGGINTCARGAQGAGGATTVSFTPTATYGFYIRFLNSTGFGAGWSAGTQSQGVTGLNTYAGGAFGLPSGPESPLHQHFTLLQNTTVTGNLQRFYLGNEDGFYSNTNCDTGATGPCRELSGDYQDFVVQLDITNPNAVPEPASIGMIGAGLLALGVIARRRRK